MRKNKLDNLKQDLTAMMIMAYLTLTTGNWLFDLFRGIR